MTDMTPEQVERRLKALEKHADAMHKAAEAFRILCERGTQLVDMLQEAAAEEKAEKAARRR